MPRIVIDRAEQGFDCSDDTVLRAALRAGLGFPHACNTGSCGNCRFTLLEGEVAHVFGDAPAWSDRDRRKNRWLGCQAVPKGDCRIKLRLDPACVPPVRPARLPARLTGRRNITHDIVEFDFAPDGEMAALPGQYALLDLPGMTQPRAYSMSRVADGGRLWQFQIKLKSGGAGSSVLAGLASGARVTLDGPYGTGYLREGAPRDIVCVAGGSGLSPMLAIARAAMTSTALSGRRLDFYYGARATRDLFDPALLPDNGARLRFVPVLSEPDSHEARTGLVHDAVEADLGVALAGREVYFAGPPLMGEAMERMLAARGVPPGQVHFDKFY